MDFVKFRTEDVPLSRKKTEIVGVENKEEKLPLSGQAVMFTWEIVSCFEEYFGTEMELSTKIMARCQLVNNVENSVIQDGFSVAIIHLRMRTLSPITSIN